MDIRPFFKHSISIKIKIFGNHNQALFCTVIMTRGGWEPNPIEPSILWTINNLKFHFSGKLTNQKERMFMKNIRLALIVAVVLGFTYATNTLIAQDKTVEKKQVSCAMKAGQDSCKAGEKKCDKDSSCCKSDGKMGDKAECCKEAMICPMSGKSANKEIFSEYKGRKVYFCCKECKAAFDKDPAKYEAKLKKCMEACKKEAGKSGCKADGKKCDKASGCCKASGGKGCEKKESKESGNKTEKPAQK
jgi:YHS domain-containing protein